MCGRSSDRQHDLTSERFPATQGDPEVTVPQPHTLLLDSTATSVATVSPVFVRTLTRGGIGNARLHVSGGLDVAVSPQLEQTSGEAAPTGTPVVVEVFGLEPGARASGCSRSLRDAWSACDQRRGYPRGRGQADERDLSRDPRLLVDCRNRGQVMASPFIDARIPFVWFATRRALLGRD